MNRQFVKGVGYIFKRLVDNFDVEWTSGVPRGGGLHTLLPEIPKALQNRAKLNPIVKTVKNCWI